MHKLKEKMSEKLHNYTEDFNENNNDFSVQDDVKGESNVILLKKNLPESFVPEFAITVSEAKQRVAVLQKFVSEMMIPEVDYGIIPGCKKPSLYKAGAEKLSDIFGFSKHVEVVNRYEDWEKQIFHYEVKITLVNKRTGLVEAEGLGSCNSREKKYASQDASNIINTILKMAKKRAIVDAVLSATRASGIFSQDLEDIKKDLHGGGNGHSQAICSEPMLVEIGNDNPSTEVARKSATKNQLGFIMKLVSDKGITIPTVKEFIMGKYNVGESKLLSSTQASDFIQFLSNIPSEREELKFMNGR